jgi:hypothetical protein
MPRLGVGVSLFRRAVATVFGVCVCSTIVYQKKERNIFR